MFRVQYKTLKQLYPTEFLCFDHNSYLQIGDTTHLCDLK